MTDEEIETLKATRDAAREALLAALKSRVPSSAKSNITQDRLLMSMPIARWNDDADTKQHENKVLALRVEYDKAEDDYREAVEASRSASAKKEEASRARIELGFKQRDEAARETRDQYSRWALGISILALFTAVLSAGYR